MVYIHFSIQLLGWIGVISGNPQVFFKQMPQKGTPKDGEKREKSFEITILWAVAHPFGEPRRHVSIKTSLVPSFSGCGGHWILIHTKIHVQLQLYGTRAAPRRRRTRCSCKELFWVWTSRCSNGDFSLKQEGASAEGRLATVIMVKVFFKNNAQRISAFSRGYFSNLQKLAWEHQTVWSR